MPCVFGFNSFLAYELALSFISSKTLCLPKGLVFEPVSSVLNYVLCPKYLLLSRKTSPTMVLNFIFAISAKMCFSSAF